MLLYHIDYVICLVGVLLSVAFFTLIERKLIGLAHYRKGPNKLFILGLSQPFSDAVKLLVKEAPKSINLKTFYFVVGPLLGIFLIILTWGVYNYNFQVFSGGVKNFLIFAFIGLLVHSILLIGWGSNSKYALIGAQRSIAQTISYEVCLLFLVLVILYISGSFVIKNLLMLQYYFWPLFFCLPLFFTWILICLAETNRPPFDIAEGESEIVSGFNIEYGGILFALIFITEYGMIFILCYLTTIFFLGGTYVLSKIISISIIFVWIRCAFPRVRYDNLIITSWKFILPISIVVLITRLV